MDLHSLHRPTPSSAHQTSQSAPASHVAAPASHVAAPADLLRQLETARANATHWQNETEKMDRIARSALDKLEAKREVRKALKAEVVTARKEADTWRARYKELADAQVQRHEAQGGDLGEKLARASREILDLNDRLATAQSSERKAKDQLQELERQMRRVEAERPAVQERLQAGGDAFRKLQALEPRAQQMEAELSALKKESLKARQLEAEVTMLKTAGTERCKALEFEVVSLRNAALKARQLELEVATLKAGAAKSKQDALEVAALKDKLRAAAQDVSARTAKTQACVDMLSRAEQVLKTCTQLHAAAEESPALTQALAETTGTIGQFLAKMGAH